MRVQEAVIVLKYFPSCMNPQGSTPRVVSNRRRPHCAIGRPLARIQVKKDASKAVSDIVICRPRPRAVEDRSAPGHHGGTQGHAGPHGQPARGEAFVERHGVWGFLWPFRYFSWAWWGNVEGKGGRHTETIMNPNQKTEISGGSASAFERTTVEPAHSGPWRSP